MNTVHALSSKKIELQQKNCNSSRGGAIYEKAKSRRNRYREALKAANDSEEAVPLGQKTSTLSTDKYTKRSGFRESGSLGKLQLVHAKSRESSGDGDEYLLKCIQRSKDVRREVALAPCRKELSKKIIAVCRKHSRQSNEKKIPKKKFQLKKKLKLLR